MLLLPDHQRILSPVALRRLAICQILVLFPFAFLLPSVFAASLFLAPLWIFWRSHKSLSTRINRWLVLFFTLLLAVAIFFYFGTFRGKDAGVTLIAAMYSLKILESKKYRDFNLLMTLGFFVLAMSFLFTQSFLAIVYMITTFVILVHALMQANVEGEVRLPWRNSIRLIAFSFPLVIFLFLFFPRLPGPLWKMPGQNTAGSGVTDSMTPGDIGDLNLSDEPAFRVKFFDGAKPTPSELYWRGLVFERYDGVTWTKSDIRSRRINNAVQSQGDLYRYSVTLEPTQQRWLFGLDIPIDVEQKIPVGSDATLAARAKILQRVRYEMASDPSAKLETELSPEFRRINLFLPSGVNSNSVQWAVQQKLDYPNAQSFVEYLLRYINRESFYYTLTPPIMREDMVDDFWFNHQRGFCEHYAGAMVVLLRAAGIPARVVTGYQGGEYNQIGDYWLIRQRDAHAWVEYWLEGGGWKRVDPTSAIAPSRIEPQLLADLGMRGFLFDQIPGADLLQQGLTDYFRLWMDNANNLWREWVIDFNQGNQFNLLSKWRLDKLGRNGIIVVAVVLFCLLVAFSGWKMLKNAPKLDDTAKVYRRLLKVLARKGFEKKASEGPKDFFSRVLAERPQWQSQLAPILRNYLHLKFSNPANADIMQRKFRQQVAQLKLSD